MKKYLLPATLISTLLSFNTVAQTERLFGETAKGTEPNFSRGTVIVDPGFENGTPNSAWTEASTNFGTPICNDSGCGLGGGTGPNSGSFWAWFGGIAAPEEGSVSQDITIPAADTVTLSFAFEAVTCDGTGFLEVLVDGNQEFLIDETDPLCGAPLGYSTIDVDLSAYQGQTVNLSFHSIVVGDDTLNFFVDDVTLEAVSSTFTVGGTLTGLLDGSEMTIQNSLGDDLILTSDGDYNFLTGLNDGEAYDVTVLAQPVSPSQTCIISNGTGMIAMADVTDVDISCDNLDLIYRNSFESLPAPF